MKSLEELVMNYAAPLNTTGMGDVTINSEPISANNFIFKKKSNKMNLHSILLIEYTLLANVFSRVGKSFLLFEVTLTMLCLDAYVPKSQHLTLKNNDIRLPHRPMLRLHCTNTFQSSPYSMHGSPPLCRHRESSSPVKFSDMQVHTTYIFLYLF